MLLKERKTIGFIAFYLFMFFAAVYVLTASGRNFYNTDAGRLRFEVAKAIVEKSDLSVPEGIGIKGSDGRYYSWVGVGSALLAVPFYIAGKSAGAPETGVSVMNQIAGTAAVILVFLFSISLGYSERASLLVSIFYGLGTFAWPLAKQPFDHAVETLFVLLAVYYMYLYANSRKTYQLLLSAVSVGIAFVTRPTSILVIPPLLVLTFSHCLKKAGFKSAARPIVKDTLLFLSALLPFLSLSLWYNHYRFGSIFETGYRMLVSHGVDYFSKTSLLRGLSGFLISPGKGFFYYSPVAVLFFFSIKGFMKRHRGLGISFIFLIMSCLFFFSKYEYWHGDWAWGPRYLLVITPFLIIPIAELFDSDIWHKSKFRRFAVYSIFILSLVIQLAAVSVDFQKYFFNLKAGENVEFTTVRGGKIQQMVVEPYFDWNKSPIVAQFKFIYDMSKKIKDYRYSEAPEDATLAEQMEVNPYMNIFDFWWACRYFVEGRLPGLAIFLLLLACYCALRLRKAGVY